jgi:hypothetical protein
MAGMPIISSSTPASLRLGRLSFERLAWHSGSVEASIAKLELVDAIGTMSSLRAGHAHLHGVEITLQNFDAALANSASLLPKPATWRLEPIDGLAGRIEALITDAHWALDADVTVPIEHGRIDFNRVTVEHIGPDSSMGLSPMGLYVDAPNGRTYLYLLSASHVPGAHFERRGGSLFGARVGDRGALELRPLIEGLLSGMTLGSPAHDAQDQLDRTRLSGTLQLGDGALGADPNEITLAGRAQGRNRITLTAEVVGREVTARLPEFSASGARLEAFGKRVTCGAITAALRITLARRSVRLLAEEISVADLAIGDASP